MRSIQKLAVAAGIATSTFGAAPDKPSAGDELRMPAPNVQFVRPEKAISDGLGDSRSKDSSKARGGLAASVGLLSSHLDGRDERGAALAMASFELKETLGGAAPSLENISANPSALRAAIQLIRLERQIRGACGGTGGVTAGGTAEGTGGVSAITPSSMLSNLTELALLNAQLKVALGDTPPTTKNILENPEARRIFLDVVRCIDIARGGAVASAARLAVYKADLDAALNGAEPTLERILDNRGARRAFLGLQREMRSEQLAVRGGDGRVSGVGRTAARLAGIGLDSRIAQAQVFDAELRAALGEAPATAENILINPAARKVWLEFTAVRNEWLELVGNPATSAALARGDGDAYGAGAHTPLTRPFMKGLDDEVKIAELRSILGGAEPTLLNIQAHPEARRTFIDLVLAEELKRGPSGF